MSRREILADTLARLEAERYTPRTSWKVSRPPHEEAGEALLITAHEHLARILEDQEDLTLSQQAANQSQLLNALSDDPVVVAFRERQGAA